MRNVLMVLCILVATSLVTAITAESQIIEVSFDSTRADINHGTKVLVPPDPLNPIAYGDVNIITGYIYPDGTWASASDPDCIDETTGFMCGAEPPPGGGPSFVPIGEVVCTGNFFANPFQFFPPGQLPVLGEEIGLFFLNVKFGDDSSNMLELRGRTLTGFDGSNPAQFSVLGGTGIFKKATGEALEIMIRPNNSGAFNFQLDLSGLRNVPQDKLMQLINGD
jgi:hypothetical protein